MERIDNFFKKFHGGYFVFIGVAIFLIGLIIAILVEPNFSLFIHHISDMGAPTNINYIIFNICWIITGFFVIIFFIDFTRYLQNKGANTKGTWLCFILGSVSAFSMILLAIFNKIDSPDMHLNSEYVFFFTGILYLIIYAILEFKIPEFSKLQAISNLIVAFLFALYLILLILNKINPGLCPEFQSFAEWLFLFGNLAWFIENGILTLKR